MTRLLIVQLLLLCIYQPTVFSCPRGVMPLTAGRCIGLTEKMSSRNASIECARMGGNLTSIMSSKHNEIIRRFLEVSKVNEATIGLTTTSRKLIDGQYLNYTNYAVPWTDKTMFYWNMYSKTGGWYLSTEYESLLGICQLPPCNESACGSYEFVDGDINCLKFRQDGVTWDAAEELCAKDRAHLAAIHSKEMNDYLTRRAHSLGHNGVHIGLRTNSSARQMAWTDGSRVQYTNFGKGFPLDVFGHCTALETNAALGKWVSDQCSSSHLPYACTRLALSPRKPLAPSTCPEPLHFSEPTVIYSPSYPGPPGVVSCDYFFVVNEGQHVKVTIEELTLNACCDKLEIYDGAFQMKPDKTLTGQVDDPISYTTTVYNVMKLSLTAEDGRNVRGFRVGRSKSLSLFGSLDVNLSRSFVISAEINPFVQRATR